MLSYKEVEKIFCLRALRKRRNEGCFEADRYSVYGVEETIREAEEILSFPTPADSVGRSFTGWFDRPVMSEGGEEDFRERMRKFWRNH